MNKRMLLKMGLDRGVWRNGIVIGRKFLKSPACKTRNLVRSAMMMVEHDRIVEHEGKFLLHSFMPPVNSEAFLNMVMRAPGQGRDFFDNYVKGKRTAPISTYIAATNSCMYHCWHCSASRLVEEKELDQRREYTTEELIRVVKKLQKLGVSIIGFTGGEPLLRKDLEQAIAVIKPTSISYVFTTGFGLTYERALSLKAAGLFGIAISVDSIKSEVHDNLRGYQGAYDIAIKAIRNAKRAGLYTMSQTLGTKELIESAELFKLARLLKKEKIDEMRIMEPIPSGKLQGKKEVILSKRHRDRLKQLHIDMNKDLRYPKVSVFPFFESEENYGCGAGSQHSYVDSKGNFGPCDFLDTFYGNLLEEDVHKVWAKMHHSMGVPKCNCIAKNCTGCGVEKSEKLPRFYRILGGDL